MIDLAAFLRVRLDEDEAGAKAAQSRHPKSHGSGTLQAVTSLMASRAARALREVEAKRAILAEHTSPLGPFTSFCHTCLDDARTESTEADKQLHPCLTLRHLAAVYSDHPDYRQEWKP